MAKKGVLDLTSFDLSSDQVLDVQGECEFYWNQLLTPRDFEKADRPAMTGYFDLPGVWNGYKVDGNTLGGEGYATFRLLIKVPKEGRYGVTIKEFDCAWHMWGNGEEMAVGKVGTSKHLMEPSWKRGELFFSSVDRQIELIFQISNFEHRKGGPEDLMVFGTSKNLREYKKSQQGISYFLLGVLLIMGFHFWGLYIFRPVEKSALNFSLINFVILLRLATTNEKVFVDLLPFVGWESQIRIEYLAYMWALPLFYAFFRSLYPTLFPKLLYRIALYLTIGTSAVVLLAPVKLFTYTPWFFQFLIMVYAFYFLVRMAQATLRRYEDAFMILNGYVFVYVVGLNDFLYYNRWIDTDFFLPLGLVVMVFTQSFVLSRRFSAAFGSVERLSNELEAYNADLENTVKMRTAEIVSKNEELEVQAESLHLANLRLEALDEFKEKMTHMIVHDLKNPLNTIIGMTDVHDIPDKDKLIRQSGKDLLNLVENMLDVAKFQQAGIELNPEAVNLYDVVEAAQKQCSFLASQRNVRFDVAIDPTLTVLARYELLERVVVNLLTNAIKHSPLNGIVSVENSDSENGFVQIRIKDEGPGIRPALRSRIFDLYFTESPDAGVVKSTGLGLAFCKLVVEAHGGTIWVDDNVLPGAQIAFTLPVGESVARDRLLNRYSKTEAAVPAAEEPIGPDLLTVFATIRVFEVSKIEQAIEYVIDQGVPPTHSWILALRVAVVECDDQEYQRLISKNP